MRRKVLVLTLVMSTAVLAANWLVTGLESAQAALFNTLVLYDGAQGGTPDEQPYLEYEAVNPFNPPFFTAQAVQTYSPTLHATILDTMPEINDYAGYGLTPTLAPVLSRSQGFNLNLNLRLAAEDHGADPDRAGFNITLLSDDLMGIEIAFWEDEIWAQEGGDPPNLFTHAEGAAFDTTAAMTAYEVAIIGDVYQLSAAGTPILSGPLRDYSGWTPPFPGIPNPYEQPNLVALSDNTSSARAETWFAYADVMTGTAPIIELMPTSQIVSETAGTAMIDVQLSHTATLTVTVDYMTVDGTAQAGVDYTAVAGTFIFTPTVSSQRIVIPILDNELADGNRTFQLHLSDPVFAQLGSTTATVTIGDDDGGANTFIYLSIVTTP